METKYPNTLISSREDKKLAYASDIYSKHFNKSIEDKVIDLDKDNNTIKSNTTTNTKNIATNDAAIKSLQTTTENISTILNTEYYSKSDINSKLSAISQNTWCTSELTDCSNDSHRAYVFHIRIPVKNITVQYITSATVKLRTNMTNVLGATKLYIKDTVGFELGHSINDIDQSKHGGEYVTWYFNPIILPTEGNLILETHFTATPAEICQLGVHVNGNKSEYGIEIQEDTTQEFHSNWTLALGFNVIPLVQLDLYNKFISLNS
uniref:Capsid protein n=1 Tax=Geladintestivirus 6 TaxID=3233138 RepID=A0AAU8MHU5_9CAUD